MSGPYEQGQVVWGDLNPVRGHEQAGHRPVLIVSENRFNIASGTVIAMPVTSQPQRAPYPLAFELEWVVGDAPASWVKPAQVRVLSTERLGAVLGLASIADVQRCLDAFLRVCGRRPASLKADNDG